MVKVVIDSNLLIAALLTRDPTSPTVRLFRAATSHKRISAHTSSFQLSELVDVLGRPKFRKLVSVDDAIRYVGLIRSSFTMVEGTYRDLDLVPKDAKDNPIVAIALEAGARYLITDDTRHLLSLKVIRLSGGRPVQVVSLEDFDGLEAF
jgi:putative PIN family toxin of toxin-antitoxin system